MKYFGAALTCALILFGLAAEGKQSCVEVLATGTPSGAQARNERDRETRITRLLMSYFDKRPLEKNYTGRIEFVPDAGSVSISSEEFDEVILQPLSVALAQERELLDLLNGQVNTKVNKAVYIVIHEGQPVSAAFYNPRALPEKPFTNSEYSGEVKAVPLNSEEGQKLLSEARTHGLSDEVIVSYYQPQSFTTFCGIASSCMVLSTMRAMPLSQDTLMRWNRHVKPEAIVKAQMGEDPGFQLGQLVRLLNSRAERAAPEYASEAMLAGLPRLKQDILASLSGDLQKIIVNFHGLTLGTLTGGHFSPVAAFVPASNMVLILDTAAHKNEPFWIPLTDLYFAMTKTDSGSGLPRGWIRVAKPKRRNKARD